MNQTKTHTKPKKYPAGINARVTPELRRQAEEFAATRGWSLMDLVREALTHYITTCPAEPTGSITGRDRRSKWTPQS